MNQRIFYSLFGLLLVGCNEPTHTDATAAIATDATTTVVVPTNNVVRIATESNYKPFSYLNAQGEHEGFEIDLIHALCAKMQTDCGISSQDWDSLIPGLQANKYDVIFASMSATDERKKVVNFSDPYFNNKLVLIGKKGDPTTIDGVDGRNVAVQQATVSAKYLQDNKPAAMVKIYDKQVNAYLDLAAGRVDYLLSDIAPALDWLKTSEGANFEIKGEAIDINDNVAAAMRQEDTALANDINAALASLKADGTYNELVAKYFDLNALGITDTSLVAPTNP